MLSGKLQTASTAISGWDLANAVFQGSPVNWFGVSAQDGDPEGMFFKPDGTKLYIAGDNNNKIYEYDLSTAWDIGTATYLQSNSFGTAPRGMFFRPDGLQLYVIDSFNISQSYVRTYDLSVAWDITTTSIVRSWSFTAIGAIYSVFFKSDGSKAYVLISDTIDAVYEYDLSTAWDTSTSSLVASYSVASQDTVPKGLFFKPDGSKMYVTGDVNNSVYEYDLSTPWDVTTASFVQSETVDSNPPAVFFKSDGYTMYVLGNSTDTIYKYALSTAWDISTISLPNPTTNYWEFPFGSGPTSPADIFFKPDGTKAYMIDEFGVSNKIFEYDLSVAWDITTTSLVQSAFTSVSDPNGVFFKPDGLKMYLCDNANNRVYEYDLSVAWDISTSSLSQNASVSTQDNEPHGIFFKPDGTKLYMVGTQNDSVYEYDLSTPWDITTISFVQSFSIGPSTDPKGIFFRPDGAKMYVTLYPFNVVRQYDLSTEWDISTATIEETLDVSGLFRSVLGIFFRPNGRQIFLVDLPADRVLSYDMV
jgi:DNA-binding beta-propeller fold protein YncE